MSDELEALEALLESACQSVIKLNYIIRPAKYRTINSCCPVGAYLKQQTNTNASNYPKYTKAINNISERNIALFILGFDNSLVFINKYPDTINSDYFKLGEKFRLRYFDKI